MKTRFQCLLVLMLALTFGGSAVARDGSLMHPVDKPFKAPDFTLLDIDGKQHRLSDYRGKVVILIFWATWCPPCRYEMPSLERAHHKTAEDDIVILGVNVGEDEDTIFEFTGSYPVEFPLVMDKKGEVVKDYPVIGIPTTYVINPQGIVTHRAIGSREWDEPAILEQLRKMAKPEVEIPELLMD